MLHRFLSAILSFALVLVAESSWACAAGTRERTAAEQDFIRKLGASLKAAMPAAPAPLALEGEPQVIIETACNDTPVGKVSVLVTANYAASNYYADRVKLTIRANYAYPGANDLVFGALPKKPGAYKVHNLVVNVDGHKADYMAAVKQALDRARLQTIIGKPLPDDPPPAAWHVNSATGQSDASSPKTGEQKSGDKSTLPASMKSAADQAKDTVNTLRGLFGR
jgi:hypothetical protein